MNIALAIATAIYYINFSLSRLFFLARSFPTPFFTKINKKKRMRCVGACWMLIAENRLLKKFAVMAILWLQVCLLRIWFYPWPWMNEQKKTHTHKHHVTHLPPADYTEWDRVWAFQFNRQMEPFGKMFDSGRCGKKSNSSHCESVAAGKGMKWQIIGKCWQRYFRVRSPILEWKTT